MAAPRAVHNQRAERLRADANIDAHINVPTGAEPSAERVLEKIHDRSMATSVNRQMAQRHPLRLLVVEDNPVNSQVLGLMLKRMGYTAHFVENGPDAIAQLEMAVYDGVFMDVQMPGMDGLEVTRQLRAHLPNERQPRIIALTAHAMQGDQDRCLAAGMDDYLSKPVQPSMLQAVLEQVRPLSVPLPSSSVYGPALTNASPPDGEAQPPNGLSEISMPYS